jgi:hypothetical protein
MDSPSVVVVKVRSKHTAQMTLIEHDDVLERVASYTADDALTIWMLPGTARGNLHLFDAHAGDPVLKSCAIGCAVMLKWMMRRG